MNFRFLRDENSRLERKRKIGIQLYHFLVTTTQWNKLKSFPRLVSVHNILPH